MVDAWLYAIPLGSAALLAWSVRRASTSLSTGHTTRVEPLTTDPAQQPRAALIINPSKFTYPDNAKAIVAAVCESLGWAAPLVLETTVDDAGFGQARAALNADVDVVLVSGGDGTVRAVGQVLAGTRQTMGILPSGTANVLARNLEIPEDDLASATKVALTGDDFELDVGWVTFDDRPEEAFLVMAGVGFDGEIMADAPAELKARVGHAAYVMSGIRKLNGPRERVRFSVDSRPPLQRRVRSVLIGNCGLLLPGMRLIPQARLDDGELDILSLSPQGIVGWAALSAEVISKRGHRIVEHFSCTRFELTTMGPLSAQIDGEAVGKVTKARARVDRGALIVRVPPPPEPMFSLPSMADLPVSLPQMNLPQMNLPQLPKLDRARLDRRLGRSRDGDAER